MEKFVITIARQYGSGGRTVGQMLAKALNYTDKTISKWENASAVPSVSVLKEIADLFGVSVDCLITDNNGNFDKKYNSEKTYLIKLLLPPWRFWSFGFLQPFITLIR